MATFSSRPMGIAIARTLNAWSNSLTAYAAGDFLSTGGYLEFPFIGLSNGAGGVIMSALIEDASKQNAAIELLLFNAVPNMSGIVDNAPIDVANGDLDTMIGIINFAATDYRSYVDNSAAFVSGLQIPFICAAGTQSIYGLPVCRGTPTYLSNNAMGLALSVVQNRN